MFCLTREMLKRINPNRTVFHLLPQANQIATDADGLPGTTYFRQAWNDVPIHMDLLALVTGKVQLVESCGPTRRMD